MRKILCMLMALSLMLALAACGSKDTDETTVPASETTAPVEKPTEEAQEQTGVSGWWVRPDDYESEGLSLMDIFQVDENGESLTVYNNYGESGSTLECSLEGDSFCIDMEIDEIQLQLDGDSLLDPMDGQVEFVRVDEPAFEGTNMSFDGKWFLGGDASGEYYELEGSHYTHYVVTTGVPTADDEGDFAKSNVQVGYGDTMFSDVLELTTEDFGPTFIPHESGRFLFVDQSNQYKLLVRESALDDDMREAFTSMDLLLREPLQTAQYEEGTMTMLRFTPLCFRVTVYEIQDDGNVIGDGEDAYGQWELSEEGTLLLHYDDGTEDEVVLPEPEEPLVVESLGCSFTLSPFVF